MANENTSHNKLIKTTDKTQTKAEHVQRYYRKWPQISILLITILLFLEIPTSRERTQPILTISALQS